MIKKIKIMKLTKRCKIKINGHLKLANPVFWKILKQEQYKPYHQIATTADVDKINKK
jgi:hypothetical protein